MIKETKPHGYGCHITTCGGQGGVFTSVSLPWENRKTSACFETIGDGQVNC